MGTNATNHALDDPFRQVIDLIPALVWSCRPDGWCDYCNRVWLDYTGLTEEQAGGTDWASVVHPEDREHLLAYWQMVLATGELAATEARLKRFDGEYRWFLFRAQAQRDAAGRIVRWYGTNTDIEDRRKAEDALRASELNFRLIVDTIPALVCTMTPTGELELVNQQTLDYFEMSRDELKNWGSIGVVHEDDLEHVTSQWRRSIETGHPLNVEHRIRRSDGAFRWFHVRGLPLRDGDAQILRWYILLVDIDDRKQAEEALRRREAELRQLVDSVPGQIATANARGEHEYANKRALDYGGQTPEALSGFGFIDSIHPADQELVRTEWIRSCQTGEPMVVDYRRRRFDGVYRWFRARAEALRDVNDQIIRWYGLLTDIEDQRAAEEALRTSEQNLRLLVETIPVFLWRTTPEGDIDYVNSRLVGYTGLQRTDLLQSGWASLVHPDDRAADQAWQANCRSGNSHDVTCRIRGMDGEYRWFRVRGEPLRQADGRILNWYGLMLDIDEGRRAIEDLIKSRSHLAHMSQVMTIAELSASIAHEVNQPLASLVANGHACVSWLSADPPNLERARITAGRVIRDANTAAQVVQRIRALFRQAPPSMVATDLNEIVQEAMGLIGNEIVDAGVVVTTDLAPSLPRVVVDRVQIQQALVNLARNALEAMKSVTDREKRLSIVCRQDGTNVLIQVRDTGSGIPNPTAIFDPFFTTKESGMGMGLAICRSIVDAHGGRLWAVQNDGPGATFSLTLPISAEF
jgi:PAS domain S-box-containing protein